MYKRLPVPEKIKLIRRILAGEKIARVCRQEGISRTILYKWLQEYKKAAPRSKQKVLASKTPQGKKHWRHVEVAAEKEILKLAIKNPSYSPRKIAAYVSMSPAGVWLLLKRHNLNTKGLRENYIYRNGKSLVKAQSEADKVTMVRRYDNSEKVSDICRDFDVSRTIFYRWLKRYKKGDKVRSVLENLRPKGERHYRFIHGASDLIVEVALKHPEYSPKKISLAILEKTGRAIISPAGAYKRLKLLSLNTYQRRLAYAKSQEAIITPTPQVQEGWRIPIFGEIPSLSALAPPGFFKKFISSKFFFPFISVIFISFILSVIISNLQYGQGIISKIGILFSFVAFFFGILFFIYSLKYYLTIAIVLSFSRRKENRENKDDRGNKTPGLNSDLSSVTLQRHPFVSIHIAVYNEKRVVERLLKAVTSMQYDNYEIIIVDDSNDETTTIVQKFVEQWNTTNKPIIKHLHRSSREGFKGGALKEALKATDPKAEYVLIFDADFIPYPDTHCTVLEIFSGNSRNIGFCFFFCHCEERSDEAISNRGDCHAPRYSRGSQ